MGSYILCADTAQASVTGNHCAEVFFEFISVVLEWCFYTENLPVFSILADILHIHVRIIA